MSAVFSSKWSGILRETLFKLWKTINIQERNGSTEPCSQSSSSWLLPYFVFMKSTLLFFGKPLSFLPVSVTKLWQHRNYGGIRPHQQCFELPYTKTIILTLVTNVHTGFSNCLYANVYIHPKWWIHLPLPVCFSVWNTSRLLLIGIAETRVTDTLKHTNNDLTNNDNYDFYNKKYSLFLRRT